MLPHLWGGRVETKKGGTTFREIGCRPTKAWVLERRDSRKVREDSGQEPKKRKEKGLGGKRKREELGDKKEFFFRNGEFFMERLLEGLKVDGR